MKCIFCYSSTENSKSVEHIVPESLGNTQYFLNKGIVCDKCNNYFATKIEQPLLELPYFKSLRHQLNIQSKKKKIPSDSGFVIDPDILKVNFHKDKSGIESIDFDGFSKEEIFGTKKEIPVFSVLFASPGKDNPYVSKFLAKLAIESLAFKWQAHPDFFDEHVNQECFEDLKHYVRRGGKHWPYTERLLYHPEAGVQTSEGEYCSIVFSMEFIHTSEMRLFYQFLIGGAEFIIDMTEASIIKIQEWFLQNKSHSPVLENALSQIHSQSAPYLFNS